MADKTQRVSENKPGRYYVDQTCIDCEFCREVAPKHFRRHDPGRYSFVTQQPASSQEESACQDAMDGCPVEAIGHDG